MYHLEISPEKGTGKLSEEKIPNLIIKLVGLELICC